MWLIDNIGNLDLVQYVYDKSTVVGQYQHYTIKKLESTITVKYGAFEEGRLVSYFWAVKQSRPMTIMTYNFNSRESYMRRGLGLALYSHAIKHDGFDIITDFEYTIKGKSFWEKLSINPLFKVGMINLITNEIDYNIDLNTLLNNDHMRYIVQDNK